MKNNAELRKEIKGYVEPLEVQYSKLYSNSSKCDAALVNVINILDNIISTDKDVIELKMLTEANVAERIKVYDEFKNKLESTHLRCQDFKDRLVPKLQGIIPSSMKVPTSSIDDEMLDYIADQYHIANDFTVEYNDILDETNDILAFTNKMVKVLESDKLEFVKELDMILELIEIPLKDLKKILERSKEESV